MEGSSEGVRSWHTISGPRTSRRHDQASDFLESSELSEAADYGVIGASEALQNRNKALAVIEKARGPPTTVPGWHAKAFAQPGQDKSEKANFADSNSFTTVQRFPVRPESPWTEYDASLEVLVGCKATLAYRNDSPYLVYDVLEEERETHLWVLQMLGQCSRPVLTRVVESFSSAEKLFVVTEYIEVSLNEVVASSLVPFEDEIAWIISQASQS